MRVIASASPASAAAASCGGRVSPGTAPAAARYASPFLIYIDFLFKKRPQRAPSQQARIDIRLG